jgi:hypothetical protein
MKVSAVRRPGRTSTPTGVRQSRVVDHEPGGWRSASAGSNERTNTSPPRSWMASVRPPWSAGCTEDHGRAHSPCCGNPQYAASDRRPVADRSGAWLPSNRRRAIPLRAQEVPASVHLRNSSDLPIRVRQIAYEVHTKWLIPEPHPALQTWSAQPSGRPVKLFIHDQFVVPPQEAWQSQPHAVNVADRAPKGEGVGLDPVQPARAIVRWVLLTDNAGRRWEVRSEEGGRAKRLRRWWRSEEYQPRRW